jgi:hypothetical protein
MPNYTHAFILQTWEGLLLTVVLKNTGTAKQFCGPFHTKLTPQANLTKGKYYSKSEKILLNMKPLSVSCHSLLSQGTWKNRLPFSSTRVHIHSQHTQWPIVIARFPAVLFCNKTTIIKTIKGKIFRVPNKLSTTPWRRMGEWVYRFTFSLPRH